MIDHEEFNGSIVAPSLVLTGQNKKSQGNLENHVEKPIYFRIRTKGYPNKIGKKLVYLEKYFS